MLNRAFNNQAPSYTSLTSQKAAAGATTESNMAFALQFGASFASLTEEELSAKILGNMGVLPNAGLQTAVKNYLLEVGKANVGIVALQLGTILSGLENATGDQAIYSAAGLAWNNELVASYNYSANPANTLPSPVGPIQMRGAALSQVAGDDAVSFAQASESAAALGGHDSLVQLAGVAVPADASWTMA